MRFFVVSIIIAVFVVGCQAVMKNENSRLAYNFNHEWRLKVGDVPNGNDPKLDDTDWKSITLPRAWNEDEAYKNDIKELSTGIAWYRKHFKLPQSHSEKKIFIEFEGVRQAATVYINGDSVGLHENGITSFGLDITPYLNFGETENVIAVRTDNDWAYREQSTGSKYQWSDWNFNANYGGIPKNVVLHVTGKVYQTLPLYTNLQTTGQYIYADNINVKEKTLLFTAETEVKNELDKNFEFAYEVIIEDPEGQVVKVIDGGEFEVSPGDTKIIKASSKLDDINLWSWGYGYLYDVHTILKADGQIIDKVTTTTGFRKTAFEDGMIKLNDRTIMVHGYAQRTSNEWPALGMSVPPWLSDYSNKLVLESNGNLVRWMHTTPWKQDIESCDRVGLMQAMPAGDSESDVEGRRWEHRVEAMRDAIIYNRNNPSIIFYEGGNEGISENHMSELKEVRDQYDPNGGRAVGSREMMESEVAEYGGEMLYINKSSDKPLWAMEYSRDEGLRKYWDEYTPPYHPDGHGGTEFENVDGSKVKDASPYNRNQDSHAIENVRRWFDYWRERPGTGARVSSGGVNIIFTDTNTHYRGAENYRRSGEADPMRLPKDGFYAHQVMWDGWVDVEKHHTHIMGHWNYEKEVVKDIYVVSSGKKVELFKNGKSLGFGKNGYRFLFTFEDVAWEQGELKAISYDENNEVLSEAVKITSGETKAVKLTLTQSPSGFLADGSDVVFVDVEVVDENGKRCPTALNMINFEIEGPAEWRGGIAKGPDNYILSKKLPVECGVNRVLIRSTTDPGTIKIAASSEGLGSDQVTVQSSSVEVTEGLSTAFPSKSLPANLDRGPTPVNQPSFEVTRESIQIVNAKAGSNQRDAHLSFDGKQSTRWQNNGNIDSGWIEFDLKEKTRVDEIALKLSGWRTRSYPIVVSVGEEVIYQGITDPNLGFFYIKPQKEVFTDHLKIRLFGQTEFRDKYRLVEITGKLDKETANDKAVKNVNSLNIVEVELFRNVDPNQAQ